MEIPFIDEQSIVRRIWGKADTVLFIFAGAAAEFALNKAVDWLYFTGKLPADPLGRLFSTVTYARKIIFSERDAALNAIDHITSIHKGVEKSRGQPIPDEAYRDVLFLLIDYSIRSFGLLEQRLTEDEKAEVFNVFHKVGVRMKLNGLPGSYEAYRKMRVEHLQQNLISSRFTIDLYKQYKKNLGWVRYIILKQVQFLLVPAEVKKLLKLKNHYWIKPLLNGYKTLRRLHLERIFKNALLPDEYKEQIKALDSYRYPLSYA
ncbi:MAG TPA: oxygenase MpaB family protein [Mucilaginibacter sp.]|nr:oxygenase MpaB family protein [Mucilaginibacter sp.]